MSRIPLGYRKGELGRKLLKRSLKELEEELEYVEQRPVIGCGFEVMGRGIHINFLQQVIFHKMCKGKS